MDHAEYPPRPRCSCGPATRLCSTPTGWRRPGPRRGAFFGRAGIERALLDCSGEAGCLVDTLRARVAEHEGAAGAGDDQTVLAMEVRSVGPFGD